MMGIEGRAVPGDIRRLVVSKSSKGKLAGDHRILFPHRELVDFLCEKGNTPNVKLCTY